MKINMLKFLALVISVFALSNLIVAQNGNSAINVNNKMNILSFNKYLPGASVDAGYFILKENEDKFCVELSDKTRRNKQHYMIENCFDLSDFKTLSNTLPSINRNSGVLAFQKLTQNSGEFTFKKDADFVAFLKRENIKLDNDLYYFKLFLGDIEESYVRDIKKLNFQPTITELGRLVWHDASVDYIEEMHTLLPGFSLNDISMLSAHNVEIEYVKEFIGLGITELSFQSIKKTMRRGITPEVIEEQKQLGNNFKDLESYIHLLKRN